MFLQRYMAHFPAAGEIVLIPVQAAHHNEMMSPAVTE
jgi:polyphosphate kinase 2 (PPK2 family)